MKTQLVKFNNGAHDSELHYAAIDLKAHNKLLTDISPFAKTLGINIDKDFLASLLKSPKEFAFDTIMGDVPLTMGSVRVSKSKAMDLIEFPDAWLKIIDLATSFNSEYNKAPLNAYQSSQQTKPARIGLESFEFIKNELALSDSFISTLKNKHSIFTKTEAQNKALELATTIGDCFESLKKLGLPLIHTLELQEYGFINKGVNGAYEFGFDPSVIVGKITTV